jgi:hypothetical protein
MRNSRLYPHRRLVDFPIEGLDITPFVAGHIDPHDAIYDLYAVSNHSGGLGGGHCTGEAVGAGVCHVLALLPEARALCACHRLFAFGLL